MDRSHRREEWNKVGDICYAIARGYTSDIPRNLFNRFERAERAGREPVRTIKASEIINIA